LEPPGHEEKRKNKEDLEEVSYGRGTERRKYLEGGEEVGSGQKASWKPFAPTQETIGNDDDELFPHQHMFLHGML
jgi:hypothetical protein